jgi:quinol-cytochrome oxidoreductase complex cytochrome b subunit
MKMNVFYLTEQNEKKNYFKTALTKEPFKIIFFYSVVIFFVVLNTWSKLEPNQNLPRANNFNLKGCVSKSILTF